MKNTFKTTILLAGLGGLIMFIASFFGGGGLVIGLVIASCISLTVDIVISLAR